MFVSRYCGLPFASSGNRIVCDGSGPVPVPARAASSAPATGAAGAAGSGMLIRAPGSTFRRPASRSPTFTVTTFPPFAMYVTGSSRRPVLPRAEITFATEPVFAAAPAPPVNTVVTTLNVVAPA
ncbi:hypothetical protein ACIP88_16710, partial [Streptomyces uncialis]|uniref:hypothetical protein n=1 Tax=Streptomyces uncialis TaxID=1048205 RepID=UPI003829B901